MYSQITHAGIFLLTIEAVLLAIGLFYVGKSLYHLSLMTEASRPINISGELSPAFAFHKAKSRHFFTLWMLYGMIVFLLGVAFMIADAMSLIHLTVGVPMGTGPGQWH